MFEITWFQILVQGIGFVGIIASVISFQFKTHKNVITFRTINELLFAVQYFMLGAYTGFVLGVVGCIRNFIFIYEVEHEKSTVVPQTVFCIIFTLLGIIVWQGPISILTIFAKNMSTIAYGIRNTTKIRMITLITSVCWLIYNAHVMSIAGVMCETFTSISIVSALIRIDVMPRLKKSAD